MPIHFALRRAFRDAAFARDELGAFYERLCPTAIELEADGRRLRLARNQGEFFLLLCFVARFHELYRAAPRRAAAAPTGMPSPAPRSSRTTRHAALWQRERAVRVPGEAGADDTFVPLFELLGSDRIDPDGSAPAPGSLRRIVAMPDGAAQQAAAVAPTA